MDLENFDIYLDESIPVQERLNFAREIHIKLLDIIKESGVSLSVKDDVQAGDCGNSEASEDLKARLHAKEAQIEELKAEALDNNYAIEHLEVMLEKREKIIGELQEA